MGSSHRLYPDLPTRLRFWRIGENKGLRIGLANDFCIVREVILPPQDAHETFASSMSPRASPYGSLCAFRAGYLCKLRREEAQPDSANGRLGAVGDLEFGDDVLYMGLHRAQADRQMTRDVLVRLPLYKELQYLQLASRQ